MQIAPYATINQIFRMVVTALAQGAVMVNGQFTADATGRQVIAGPVEATALGNLIVQAMAVGAVSSLGQGRAVIRRSFEVITYEPAADRAGWDEAYARLLSVMSDE